MYILRIEHPVPNFEIWKQQAFDSDPLDRKGSGVKDYRVMRSAADSNFAVIDLSFDTAEEAEVMLEKLKRMWQGVKKRFEWREMPRAMIVEVVEKQTLK